MQNSSQEYITATIIHEALHAYIGVNYSAIQHEEMAKNYVLTMVSILRGIYPNLSQPDAMSLAWGGLEGTAYYTNPPIGTSVPPNQASINGQYRYNTNGIGHGCPVTN